MTTKIPRAIVGAHIFDTQERLFLMRSSGKYGDEWIIPGGKVDFGETILAGLKREIKEETNLDLHDIQFCGVRELVESERHFIFLEHKARALNTADVRLNNEATEFGWFAKADLEHIKIAAPTLELIHEHWR